MALRDHLQLRLLIDGVLQVEASNIKVQSQGKSQPIETLQGLVGKTQGSGMVTVTGTCAVPIGGPEFNFFRAIKRGTYHTIQVPMGPTSYIGNGWFDEAEISQSVNGATEISFTWMGEFTDLK